MNLGFDFEISDNVHPYFRFSDKNKLEKEIDRLLTNIRSIKTADLIKEYNDTLELIDKMKRDNYKQELIILINNSTPVEKDEIYLDKPETKINDILTECKEVLEILNKYKDEELFYKILVKLFKDNCAEYSILNKYIIGNMRGRTQLIYGKDIIKRDYVIDIDDLFIYKQKYWFTFTF